MIDYKPHLLKELQTVGLPVYYELFLTKDTELPCISYIEANNYTHSIGDTLGYSDVYYNIKVWGREIKTLQENALKIDDIMRKLGFKRTGSSELWMEDIGQLQLRYQGLALENY